MGKVYLLSGESSALRDRLASSLCTNSAKNYCLAGGFWKELQNYNNYNLNLLSDEQVFSKLSTIENTFTVNIPYPVSEDKLIFDLLDVHYVLAKFFQKYFTKCSKCQNSLHQKNSSQDQINNLLFSVKVPSTLVDFEEIEIFFQKYSSSIFCLNNKERYQIHDPKFKLVLEELNADEDRFAYIGEGSSIADLMGIQDLYEDSSIFVSINNGDSWQTLDTILCENCYKHNGIDLFKHWHNVINNFIYLNNTSYFSTSLVLDCTNDKYSNLDLPSFFSFTFKEVEILISLVDENSSNCHSHLLEIIKLLNKFGFSEYTFLTDVSTLDITQRSLLKILPLMLTMESDFTFVLSSYLSGIPQKLRSLLIKEINNINTDFNVLVCDDSSSFSRSELNEMLPLNEAINKDTTISKSFLTDQCYILRGDYLKVDEFIAHECNTSLSDPLIIDFRLENHSIKNNSTFGSYADILKPFRSQYVDNQLSKVYGFEERSFSFYAKEGRCPICHGRGVLSFDDRLLKDAEREHCFECHGGRLNSRINIVKFYGYSFNDLLRMPIEKLIDSFEGHVKLESALNILKLIIPGDVSLGTDLRSLSMYHKRSAQIMRFRKKFSRPGQLIVIRGVFRGTSFNESSSLMNLISTLLSSFDSRVFIDDPSEFCSNFKQNIRLID